MIQILTSALTQFADACPTRGITILPSWYKYLDKEVVSGRCSVKFVFSSGDIGKVLLAIVEIMLRLGALIAIAYVVYGGFQYITSQGEPDKTKGARQTIQNALIGLVIAISATAIVNLVGSRF